MLLLFWQISALDLESINVKHQQKIKDTLMKEAKISSKLNTLICYSENEA